MLETTMAQRTMRRIALLAVMCLAPTGAALAQSAGNNVEFYVGLGAGASVYALNSQDFSFSNGNFGSASATSATVSQGTAGGAVKYFVGARFFQYFGVEIGAGDLGTVNYTTTDNAGGVDSADYSVTMAYYAALLMLPVSDDSYFHVKLGSAAVSVTMAEQCSGTLSCYRNYSTSSNQSLVGLGFTMGMGKSSKLRVEYEGLGEVGMPYNPAALSGSGTGRATVGLVTVSAMLSF